MPLLACLMRKMAWFSGVVGECRAGMAAAAKGAKVEIAALRHRTARVVKVIADGATS